MSSMRRSTTFLAALAAASVLATTPAAASSLIPVKQDRSTFVFVDTVCQGHQSDGDAAKDFAPFNSVAAVFQNCDARTTFGWAIAEQASAIGETSITGAGSAFAAGESPFEVRAFGWSSFEVTFILPAASDFALAGTMSVNGGSPGVVVAVVSLSGPRERTIVAHQLIGDGNGPHEQMIDATGILQPGQYTLHAVASISAGDFLPLIPAGDAAFDFRLDLGNPADLDGDGEVGPTDLGNLLAAWGPCPVPPAECPADLDGNGEVNAGDLGTLLAAWG